MSGSRLVKGLYVSAGAVSTNPEYAEKLVNEAGVNLFVLRCGFDPLDPDPELGRAMEITKGLGAQNWLLTGTWWGKSSRPQVEEMIKIIDESLFPPTQSFEAQFEMRGFGGEADRDIGESILGFCRKFAPEGICLTHSRYRSPAYLAGLFDYSPGRFEEVMSEQGILQETMALTLMKVVDDLRQMESKDLLRVAEGRRLDAFLNELGGSDVFSRWFDLREAVLRESVSYLRSIVKKYDGNILFGSNAFDPFGAPYCGQYFDRMEGVYDFVEPLLSYMLWHIYEPLVAWARVLLKYVPGLDQGAALEAATNFFGYEGINFGSDTDSLLKNEGEPEVIRTVIERAINLCKPFQSHSYELIPVLRGRDWPIELIRSLEDRVLVGGFDGVIYQGAHALGGEPPGEGWY